MTAQARLSVSTWSLHRTLGLTYPDSPERECDGKAVETYGSVSMSLLELPERIAGIGIHTLEICHFHLYRQDTGFLQELRAALAAAEVELFSLLIDDGDITSPDHAERDLAWIGRWLEVAGMLGAQRARVIAGKADTSPEALEQSKAGLTVLAQQAADQGVRLMTENWFPTLSTPQAVNWLLDEMDGQVGLCADFGNWNGPTKYDDLAAILPRAESCHAKCSFAAPQTADREDYLRCLDLTQAAGFSGPYTLIYDGPSDHEWSGIGEEIEMVRPYLAAEHKA